MARIGIYGGTFNPPHKGHVQAVQAFAEGLRLDRVLMIPDAQPPHKLLPDGSPSPETRLQLCRLAVQHLPFVTVSPLEIRRSGKSYTAETVEALHQAYPQDELFLLMGTDMFLSFHRWRDPQRICACVRLAMADRSDPSAQQRQAILQQQAYLQKTFGAAVTRMENPVYDISSSTVRRLLCFGAGETELPLPVFDEIVRLGLYHTGENLRGMPFDALKEISLSLHKPSRVAHAEGCCCMAQLLAQRWGESTEDAARAGILHDVTKALDGREQLILCGKYDIILDRFSEKNRKLLHAITGAAVAAHIFGENEKICSAIRYHTTGKADMSTFQKSIYLADLIEPSREFPGVADLRAIAMDDLDQAMLLALRRSVEFVESGGDLLHPDSLEALNWQETKLQACPAQDK